MQRQAGFDADTLPDAGRQAELASRPFDPFFHAFESKVAALLALHLTNIEAAAVVDDTQSHFAAAATQRNLDMRGTSVKGRVMDRLSRHHQ